MYMCIYWLLRIVIIYGTRDTVEQYLNFLVLYFQVDGIL